MHCRMLSGLSVLYLQDDRVQASASPAHTAPKGCDNQNVSRLPDVISGQNQL